MLSACVSCYLTDCVGRLYEQLWCSSRWVTFSELCSGQMMLTLSACHVYKTYFKFPKLCVEEKSCIFIVLCSVFAHKEKVCLIRALISPTLKPKRYVLTMCLDKSTFCFTDLPFIIKRR